MITEEQNEKMLEVIEEETKLLCPFCKGYIFERVGIEHSIVEMYDTGDGVRDESISTFDTMNFTYTCKNCGKDVTNEEMIK